VLIRAVGPTLASYGVQGALADPQVRLLNQGGGEIAINNDWGTIANQAELASVSASVGAFGLEAGSKDAVILATLQPGIYTTHVSGVAGGTGIALVEIYDASGGDTSRLINISSRAYVGTGANIAIPGFVVSGNAPRTLLIRGVGPTLASYGVEQHDRRPAHHARRRQSGHGRPERQLGNQRQSPALTAATSAVYAFQLLPEEPTPRSS